MGSVNNSRNYYDASNEENQMEKKMVARTENSRIIVQSDWNESLRKEAEQAWVSFRKFGQSSVYGELKCVGLSSNGVPYVDCSEGFSAKDISLKGITICYNNECQCKFKAPVVTYSEIHPKSVECLDVTPGGLAVSSDVTGRCKVWTTEYGEVRRTLEGHAGDVYTCRFFPSGTVILTGGADTQLKIWSAETGQCAVTLRGHQAGVTDTAIVERGKNILSTSTDGTAKLWDCGSQACLATWDELGGAVNGCALQNVTASCSLGRPEELPSEKEVLTEGKLLLLAVESGDLCGFGLQSRKKVFSIACGTAVNCCSFISDTTVVCGTQDSEVLVIDIRNTSTPLKHMKEMRSAIHSFLPHGQGFFTTTGEGSCYYTDETFETSLELTGPDCDPVYKVVTDGSYLYTSCRDHCIRKYQLQ